MNETPLEIDVQAVKQALDDRQDFLLIDCREPQEYELVCIEGAQLIPMNETPQRLAELESHREKQIVIHCHHGGRSLQVAQWLRGQGFSHAQSMQGGIDDWAVQIDDSLPRY